MARKRSGVTFRAPRLRTLSWVRPQRPAFAAGRGPPRLSAPERVAASASGVANAGVSGDSWTWTLDPGPWTWSWTWPWTWTWIWTWTCTWTWTWTRTRSAWTCLAPVRRGRVLHPGLR